MEDASSYDCAITNRVVSPSSFDCSNEGANVVTLTVTDSSGNSASATATVTVHDDIAPTHHSPPINLELHSTAHLCITAAQVDNGSTDNCLITNPVVSPSR